jgi:ABC-2 type transport system permease protein
MSKLWLVAIHEYRVDVFKKSFILVLLSVPLFIAFNLAFVYVIASFQTNDNPVGYIDQSGLRINPGPSSAEQGDDPLQFIGYLDENEAQSALDAGQIQAYFILPADYSKTSQVMLIYNKRPDERVRSQFLDLLRRELVSSLSPQIAARITSGDNLTIRTLDGKRTYPGGGPNLGNFLPLLLSLAFVGLLVLSSGYLMGSIFKERENRAIEALMTSLSSRQLIWGKVFGSVAIGLTMFAAWIAVTLLAIWVGQTWFDFPSFQNLQPDWASLAAVTAVAIPSYILAAALMFSVGVMAGNRQDSEQVGPLFFLAYFAPIFFAAGLIENPQSPLSVALSLAPFTCVLTIGIRAMVIQIPLWQIAASIAIQCLAALAALGLARRAFRYGMLRFGRRLNLKEVLRSEWIVRRE